MKKSMVFGVSLFLCLFLVLISAVSGVRINEVELNPEGTDAENEWIELYSESEVNLTGYILENNDNDIFELNMTFQGFYIISFESQWLDNANETVILKDENDSVIDESVILDDDYDDDKTWQYCNGDWNFTGSTKDDENYCPDSEPEEDGADIYLELEFDDEIENSGEGEMELEVEVKAYNLKDRDYDIKISVIDEDGKIISEIYDEIEDEWKSSIYYVNKMVHGPGNETEIFKLRIEEDEKNFIGEAKIEVKIRENGGSLTKETEEDIEIIGKEEAGSEDNMNGINAQQSIEETSAKISGNSVIKLGKSKKVESANNSEKGEIVYESGMEKFKKYAPYAFNIILIAIIIFLLKKEEIYKRLNSKID